MYQEEKEERQEWCWEKKQAQVAQKRKGKVNFITYNYYLVVII